MLTFLIHPALSAIYTHEAEDGSPVMSKILDGKTIGLPFLLSDFAARRARVASDALLSFSNLKYTQRPYVLGLEKNGLDP